MEGADRTLSRAASRRGSGSDLKVLRRLLAYLAPYRRQVAGAIVALVVAAVAVLSLGVGLRHLIDGGFSQGTPRRSTTRSRPC
jgi:ATP-binding cassette subfamily B protein